MSGPRPWTGRCHRCGAESDTHTMSWFNTDLLCLRCSLDVEGVHPDLEYAKRMEEEAVRQGNYNWVGPGYPGVNGRVRRGNDER